MGTRNTIYYDCFSGLIPVSVVSIETGYCGVCRVNVRIKRDYRAYKRGEILEVTPNCVVRKARVSGGHQLVKPAIVKVDGDYQVIEN